MLHHTTFATLKLDEMIDFYEAVAGLEAVYRSAEGAWLTTTRPTTGSPCWPCPDLVAPVAKGHTTGLHHTAFEYATFEEWIDNYVRLKQAGIVPFLNLDHGITMSMYYQDPEGNGVEIQVDAFGDWRASKEWMWASEEFDRSPIGTYFDPDKLVDDRNKGLTFAEIHAKARAGEYEPAVHPEVYLPELW